MRDNDSVVGRTEHPISSEVSRAPAKFAECVTSRGSSWYSFHQHGQGLRCFPRWVNVHTPASGGALILSCAGAKKTAGTMAIAGVASQTGKLCPGWQQVNHENSN